MHSPHALHGCVGVNPVWNPIFLHAQCGVPGVRCTLYYPHNRSALCSYTNTISTHQDSQIFRTRLQRLSACFVVSDCLFQRRFFHKTSRRMCQSWQVESTRARIATDKVRVCFGKTLVKSILFFHFSFIFFSDLLQSFHTLCCCCTAKIFRSSSQTEKSLQKEREKR